MWVKTNKTADLVNPMRLIGTLAIIFATAGTSPSCKPAKNESSVRFSAAPTTSNLAAEIIEAYRENRRLLNSDIIPIADLVPEAPRFVLFDGSQALAVTIRTLISLQNASGPTLGRPAFWLSLERINEGPSDSLGQDLSPGTLVWLREWDEKSSSIALTHFGQNARQIIFAQSLNGMALLPVSTSVARHMVELLSALYAGNGTNPEVLFDDPTQGGALHVLSWLRQFGTVDLYEDPTRKENAAPATDEMEPPPRTSQLRLHIHPLVNHTRTPEGTSYQAALVGVTQADGSQLEFNGSSGSTRTNLPYGFRVLLLNNDPYYASSSSLFNPRYGSPGHDQGYLLAQSVAGYPDSISVSDDFQSRIEGLDPFLFTKLRSSPKGNALQAVISEQPVGTGHDLKLLIRSSFSDKDSTIDNGRALMAGLRAYAYTMSRLLRIVNNISEQGYCHNNINLQNLLLFKETEQTTVRLAGFGEFTPLNESPRTPGTPFHDGLPVLQQKKCMQGSDLTAWAFVSTQLLFDLNPPFWQRSDNLEALYQHYSRSAESSYMNLLKRIKTSQSLSEDDKMTAIAILDRYMRTALPLIMKKQNTSDESKEAQPLKKGEINNSYYSDELQLSNAISTLQRLQGIN